MHTQLTDKNFFFIAKIYAPNTPQSKIVNKKGVEIVFRLIPVFRSWLTVTVG